MARFPVESERSKARTTLSASAAAGTDPKTELARLRSWAITRGFQPAGQMSWTITDGGEYEVRYDIQRETTDIEIRPEERVRLQHLPSVHMVRAILEGDHADPPRIAAAIRDWALRYGYEPVGDIEVFPAAYEHGMEVGIPVKRPAKDDWIEI